MTTARNGSPAGRVAIVTGGSRGIGRAAARRLAAGGYAVAVSYLRDQRAAESAVEAILADNGNAVAIRADIADDLDVERLFAETIAAFGGIDVVVHAAGSRITATPVTEAALDEFDALVRINTRATFVVNQQAARHLRDGGAIVNLSSSAGGSSLRTHGLYAATKALTDVLTRALALELGERNITVNAVSVEAGSRAHPARSPTSSRTCSASTATASPARCSGSATPDCCRRSRDTRKSRGRGRPTLSRCADRGPRARSNSSIHASDRRHQHDAFQPARTRGIRSSGMK